jgi:hypothetical protein
VIVRPVNGFRVGRNCPRYHITPFGRLRETWRRSLTEVDSNQTFGNSEIPVVAATRHVATLGTTAPSSNTHAWEPGAAKARTAPSEIPSFLNLCTPELLAIRCIDP